MPRFPAIAACVLLSALAGASVAIAGTARAATAAEEPAPVSKHLDALARKRLVGEHRLTLQWLGFGDLSRAGKATIEQRGDTLSLTGEQSGQGENAGDYLRIAGEIVSADQEAFVFVGDILTRVGSIAEGAACKRSGTFHFRTRGIRQYWRLQEMDNPCGAVTDYVDVYFLGV